MKKPAINLVLLSLFLLGCSTDFEMYEEYKDVSIVYCIADISDDTTWVKISKAFYGPGNFPAMAQNPDSSNYPYKLDAKLIGNKNGLLLDPIQLDTITIQNKELTDTVINQNGDTTITNPFYSPNQLMYYAVGNLDENTKYTLNITKNNGDQVTSSSGLVGHFYVTEPERRIVFDIAHSGEVRWLSAKNGARYQFSMRFNYSEYVSGYPDTLQKSVDWYTKSVPATSDIGGESMGVTYAGSEFFNAMEMLLPEIPNVQRWAENIEIKIICGSKVLVTYLDINSVGNNTLLEVPTYTNIEGGAGIFASRHTILTHIPLSRTTEYYLITHYDLGFRFKQN